MPRSKRKPPIEVRIRHHEGGHSVEVIGNEPVGAGFYYNPGERNAHATVEAAREEAVRIADRLADFGMDVHRHF